MVFGSVTFSLQDYVRILGVHMNRELSLNRLLKHVPKQAFWRVSALCRKANFLDKRIIIFFYKAQVRSYLENVL